MSTARTLNDVLRGHAAERPELAVLTYLADGDAKEETLTYAELDRRARAIAVHLAARAKPGDRALMLFAPGLDFIASFWGCLYAGVIAVPTFPPDPGRLQRTLPRLLGIVDSAEPTVVLTTRDILQMAELFGQVAPQLQALAWIATDELADPDGWRDPGVGPEALACLQYTSGSTGDPKGVMLSHGNLVANSAMIERGMFQSRASRCVSWLPPYHDMGLIGGILNPLYVGYPVVLMSPMHFLRRPIRWLRAVSRYRATTSGGPNFAFDLCVRKINDEDRASLDLSSWEMAFVGAEPVQAATLERFAERFAPQGFRARAFFPCYGLAEATLFVSGGAFEAPAVVRAFDAVQLEHHRGVPVDEGSPQARRLVGSGHAQPGHQVLVVDGETGAPRAAGEVGEVWTRGPSIAQGYWGREETTLQRFGARATDGEAYLRTGDLGFFDERGELFVTGRVDDLMIIRGQNHYPQDIERTVEAADPCVRLGCVAAFCVAQEREQRLVVVAEVEQRHVADRRQSAAPAPPSAARRGEDRRHDDPEPAGWELAPAAFDARRVVNLLREAITARHQLQAAAIVLIKAGSIPKTTSGKIQRRACRVEYLERKLTVIHAEDWIQPS